MSDTNAISKAIKSFSADWLANESNHEKSVMEINQGRCYEFAEAFLNKYGSTLELEMADAYDCYKPNADEYNIAPAVDYYLMETLLEIFEEHDHMATHTFIYSEKHGLYFDAECTDGVENPLELPMFRRFIREFEGYETFEIDMSEPTVFDLQSAVDSLAESQKTTSPKIG